MRLVIGIGGKSVPRSSVSVSVRRPGGGVRFRDLAPFGLSQNETHMSDADVAQALERYRQAGEDAVAILGERRSWPVWERLMKETEATGLLIYEDPIAYVAGRLADGESLHIAAEDWREASTRLLNAAEACAERPVMVNAADIAHAPEAFAYYCETHFGVELDVHAVSAPALERMIAGDYVRKRGDIWALAEELDVRSEVIGDREKETRALAEDAQEVFQELREKAERVPDLEADLGLVTEQLHHVQYKAEIYYRDAKRGMPKAGLSDTDKMELARLSAEVEHARHEVSALRQSTSWRLTAPVRLASRGLRKLTGLRRLLAERRHAALLKSSPLFDADWYRREYPDVAASRLDPAVHFVRFGGSEGRSSSPKFNAANYLKANPDVAVAGINPLVHYIQYGQAEARPGGAA